jgi:hypothetical protein
MAQEISTVAKNAMLDYLRPLMTHVQFHVGNPGPSGTGAAAYGARQAITWAAASAGSLDSSNIPELAVGAGDTIGGVSFWSALSSGVCYGGKGVTAETFTNAGTYRLLDADYDLNNDPA